MTRCWRRCGLKLAITSWSIVGGVITIFGDCALAQIAPDGTLGDERSVVTPNVNIKGVPSDRIDGGAIRGANLFHSFQEFNVGEGRGAYFSNPVGIENILGRVTGNDRTEILGKLGVLGNANLFLINPNGIIFGPNASLDVGGSFLASTASSVNFADGTQFSATARPTTPLLSVSVPLGLQFGGNAGSIINQSQATNSSGEVVGLEVQPDKTLALVGGDIWLDGGNLQAPGGRVELGGVAGQGTVGLNNVDGSNLRLSFPDDVARADVSLTNNSEVNVRAFRGGSIAINAQNLNIAGKSILQAGIASGLGFIGSVAGDIEINATEATNLIDTSFIFNAVLPGAVGNGGDINIMTGSLSVTNGAQLNAATSGQGNAGSVNIYARDTVSFDGVGSDGFSSGAFSSVQPGAEGNGGNLNITSGSLSVTNGAFLVTSAFGYGDAGSVDIYALEVSFDSSAAFSTVQSEAVGNSGGINITTVSLSATNGAALVASTRGRGNAGNVNINARDTVSFNGVGNNQFNIPNFSTVEIGRRDEGSVTINVRDPASFTEEAPDLSPSGVLSQVESTGVGRGGSVRIAAGSLFVTDGAVLTASTLGQGDAGDVMIDATTFEADSGGQVLNTTSSGSKAGNININTADSITLSGSKSGLFANTTPDSTGDGGSISIDPIKLTIMDGAGVAVDSQGTGNAGDLLVTAGEVTLDGGAFLSAAAASAKGGNIRLDLQDLLLMSGNSQISATSGNLGNEGNINIDTDILAAFENSNIIANAFAGPGANIQIKTQGIFLSPDSEVIASGSTSIEGTVEVGNPNVLPEAIADVTGLIAQGCPGVRGNVGSGESKFIITGRGGLPPNPRNPLNSNTVWVDWVTLNPGVENSSSPTVSTNPTAPESTPIVEARGWAINGKGEVVLTANAPTTTPHSPWIPSASCHTPEASSWNSSG